MTRLLTNAAFGAVSLSMAACSQGGDGQAKAAPPPPAAAPPPHTAAPPKVPAPKPPPPTTPVGPAGAQALVDNINGAGFALAPAASGVAGAPEKESAPDPMLIKAQVLLARADASPGVIDGLRGSNFQHAVSAFESMNGIDDSHGMLTQAVWAKLNATPPQPVAAIYTVTAQDAAGPYYPDVGENLVAMSKLKQVGYTRPSEMLAERFHMSEDALKALNPGADFGKMGTVIAVAQPGAIAIPRVDHIRVDKAHAAVRAYDREDKEIAFMPATVGSTDKPSPTGVHKVNGVAHDPKYTYDPKKLTWGPKKQGKFVVPSGPNNPVGVVWIDLNAPSYGLHGTPSPSEIGKTASHGCVRMTNWDATQLAGSVRPGVTVTFVNSRA